MKKRDFIEAIILAIILLILEKMLGYGFGIFFVLGYLLSQVQILRGGVKK